MSKTILCADDSATMQTVAEITFRSSDFSYAGARSADEALAQAKKAKPALVLVDAVLPGKTGYDLCRDIKSDPSLADVPVVLLCGNSQPYDEAKGRAAGCDGHVTKPWDTQKMLDQIAELMERTAKDGVAKPGAAAAGPSAPGKPVATPPPPSPANKIPNIPVKASPGEPPRSATLMGMPSVQMPPAKATPGVTPIQPPSKQATNNSVPKVAPKAAASAERAPLIRNQPTKPIRLVLASQAHEAAVAAAQGQGLDPEQAASVAELSREILERVVWEVVPDLAEAIIRENLDTLAAKAR